MTPPPRVDDLRAGYAEPFGNLSRSYEVVHVELPSHAPDVMGLRYGSAVNTVILTLAM
jgi:hypothetical protein